MPVRCQEGKTPQRKNLQREISAEPAQPVCRGFNLPNRAQQLRASATNPTIKTVPVTGTVFFCTVPVLPVCRGFNLPNRAQHSTASTTTRRKKRTHYSLFTRAQSECQSHAQCEYDNDKKFRSSLFKGLRVQGRALGTYRHALSNGLYSPSLDQESSRNLSRGSRYGKRGSMPLFSYLCEV